ncbi:MAG: ester cyclase [Dehalococcoidales bacterium]|jgi:predicted ester cyclase|nr:ester cyclase [Dehalococcoidales bacterium]
MSIEENKKTVALFFSAMKVADVATLDKITTDDFAFMAGEGGGIKKPMFLDMIKNTIDAISNHTNRIDDIVAEGNKVAVRMTVTGTLSGEWMGFKPTGKSFEINEYFFLTLKDGKIQDYRGIKDALGQFQQMGIIPPLDEFKK